MMNVTTNKVRRSVPHHQTAHVHALQLAAEAERWAGFALERSRMRPATVYQKALQALSFSLEHRAHHFAVPSKLCGTRETQALLAHLAQEGLQAGHRLVVRPTEVEAKPQLLVQYGEEKVGYVQDKHVPWLRPLVTYGASVHLLAVTGAERTEGYMGINVAFAHLTAAMGRLEHILGRVGGDGAGGDGAPAEEDVLLWRDPDGTARSNVTHVTRHSSTGIEWGYGGSGPADLARSVLLRFVPPEEADRHYQQFKRDVIASLSIEGGLIEAAFVRSWLAEQQHRL